MAVLQAKCKPHYKNTWPMAVLQAKVAKPHYKNTWPMAVYKPGS